MTRLVLLGNRLDQCSSPRKQSCNINGMSLSTRAIRVRTPFVYLMIQLVPLMVDVFGDAKADGLSEASLM